MRSHSVLALVLPVLLLVMGGTGWAAEAMKPEGELQSSERTAGPDASAPPSTAPRDDPDRTRFAGAYSTNGKPMWTPGGTVSSRREAALVHSMASAYRPLMGLLWLWLTVRALVVDRRGRWMRLVVVGIVGAPCVIALLAYTATGIFAYLNDRISDGPATLAGFLAAGAIALMIVEGVANPTFRDRHGHRRSSIALQEPTFSARWQRPGLTLCRWGLAGVGVGFIALGGAVGFGGDAVVPLDSGPLHPMYVALGLAAALALVGLIKASVTAAAQGQ